MICVGIRWEAVIVDAHDPQALAAWWARTLGWELLEPNPAGVEVRSPEGRAPSLFFTAVPEAKSGKNRLHLDLYADDQSATVDDLLARGATRADVGQAPDALDVVPRDPEGNEFCLLEPR